MPPGIAGRLFDAQKPLHHAENRRNGRKMSICGEMCCKVGESGVEWRPTLNRTGMAGFLPLRHPRSRTPLQRETVRAWRFWGSSSTRWTRRTGSRSRPSSGAPLSDGVVLAKELETCVSIWPVDGLAQHTEQVLGARDPFDPEARDLQRLLHAGAFEAQLDAAGRVMLPPAADRARRPRQGRDGDRQPRLDRGLGPRALGQAPARARQPGRRHRAAPVHARPRGTVARWSRRRP